MEERKRGGRRGRREGQVRRGKAMGREGEGEGGGQRSRAGWQSFSHEPRGTIITSPLLNC